MVLFHETEHELHTHTPQFLQCEALRKTENFDSQLKQCEAIENGTIFGGVFTYAVSFASLSLWKENAFKAAPFLDALLSLLDMVVIHRPVDLLWLTNAVSSSLVLRRYPDGRNRLSVPWLTYCSFIIVIFKWKRIDDGRKMKSIQNWGCIFLLIDDWCSLDSSLVHRLNLKSIVAKSFFETKAILYFTG